MRTVSLATNLAIVICLVVGPATAQLSKRNRLKTSDTDTKQSAGDTKRLKKKSRDKTKTSGKREGENMPQEDKTRERANDPQMPADGNLPRSSSRPGTPPTFPPNPTSPKTPVRPPDPTSPTTVNP